MATDAAYKLNIFRYIITHRTFAWSDLHCKIMLWIHNHIKPEHNSSKILIGEHTCIIKIIGSIKDK